MKRRGEQEAVRAWVRTVLEPGAPAGGAESGEVCREVWASLELPPPAGTPADFAPRVWRAWNREHDSAAPILGAPWMRAAAAAALLAGVVLGSALSDAGNSGGTEGTGDSLIADSAEMDAWEEGSLSEEYLSALDGSETALVDGTGTAVP